jgi:transposase
VDIITAHINRKLTIKESATRLGMSVSGFKKLAAKYRKLGLPGLSHGLRGKPPNRSPHPHKGRILDLAKGKYRDFNVSQTCELLEGREGLRVLPETLRLWLVAGGKPVRRHRRRHRQRREPKGAFGEMLQIDGSFHPWLDGQDACMIHIVDDSTRTCMMHFAWQETIESACLCAWRWMRRHGVPKSFYADGRNMRHLLPAGEDNFFTSMCRQLGIRTIRAFSPQAKGRVERGNGTHQSRLVPLLRLDGVKTLEELNTYVQAYEDRHNGRFGRKAPDGDCHRPLPKWARTIDDVCWTQTERVAGNDWTIRYKNRVFQIEKWSSYAPAKSKVVIKETISGKVSIMYRGKIVRYRKVATF